MTDSGAYDEHSLLFHTDDSMNSSLLMLSVNYDIYCLKRSSRMFIDSGNLTLNHMYAFFVHKF